jgi:hypothetical protein
MVLLASNIQILTASSGQLSQSGSKECLNNLTQFYTFSSVFIVTLIAVIA